MGLFTREQFGEDADDAGVFINDLGRAMVIYTAMQDATVTVASAAAVFNTTPEVIREAIEDASWIGWHGPDDDPSKQVVETDGE